MCKECHSGKCFAHISETGIHSSEALMTVELDKTYGKWHSIHTVRRETYEGMIPGLLWATKMGVRTSINYRLVHFARIFQTPRPLNKQLTLGFYDKKLPDPEEVSCQLVCTEFSSLLTVPHQVDQLDPVSAADLEATNPRIREETPVQRHSHHPESNSPAVAGLTEVASRKRKRPSEPPSLNAGPNCPSQPSQPTMDDRASVRSSQTSKPSKRWIMDCVLITTLPPRLRRKPAPPETSGDEDDRSQARATTRGREKRRGKRREVAPTSRVSVRPGSRSLVDESMRSRSHSVSSIRPPLFEPVSAKSL